MAIATRDTPVSAAFFCPQSRAPPKDYLDALYHFLSHNTLGSAFLHHIQALDDLWPILSSFRQDIKDLPNARANIRVLVDWAKGGPSTPISEASSGVIALPAVFIVQFGQYIRYLDFHQISHADFIAQLQHVGGVHGYCGGAAAALSVACAADETQLIDHAAVLLRLFLGIGCCIEAVDDWTTNESTVLACRLRFPGQGKELCSRFPGTYVSAITEPKSVSITGNARTLSELYDYAISLGLPTHKMDITGKAHNPENAELAQDFIRLYKQTPALQLPATFKLHAPVRSNRTADKLSDNGIIEDMITMIIASCCDWNELLGRVAEDMKASGRASHQMVSFGMNDCVPVMPFNKQRLKTTKFEAHVLIELPAPVAAIRGNIGEYPELPDDAIAITGASCRLPGASNLDELWKLISQGIDCHREIPSDRFSPHDSFRVKQSDITKDKKFFGNFLDDIKGFDRAYFGMGAREAANIDPQQRLLLELAVEALDASGYLATHTREAGDRVGCFVGASFIEYLENTGAHPPTAYTAPGTIRAFLCGRLSYYFGWTAPAEVIDTACSASMVAINRACKSILSGECELALAGGVNLITGINNYLDLGKAHFLSPTGQCKPFDQSGDGYCRSDGAGLVVLKKLKQALADGDPIMGVIPAVATNQGGLSTALTVPSATALKALYRKVVDKSGLKPADITYVEAHGTGTQAGDPIEVDSIRAVFGDASRDHAVSIGSIKGNIGHCETGAGVAGLLKVLAMFRYGGIPPLASHQTLNPKIPALEPDQIQISKKLTPWDAPLRAALVNSYGAAGSNAALICCEPPPVSDPTPLPSKNDRQSIPYPIVVSGASKQSLLDNAKMLAAYLSNNASHINIGDAAFVLNHRRKRHRFCADVSATDTASLSQALSSVTSPTFEYSGQSKPVVLVFTGQNTDKVALDRTTYNSYPRFRFYIDSCDAQLTQLGYPSISEAIFQKEPIVDAVMLQCSIFAMQYACARCWIDAGLKPQAIIGHSFGELTALAISGALSLEHSLKLVTCRAHLINTKWGDEKGGMLVVHADLDTVQSLQSRFKAANNGAELEIACYNSATTIVVAGACSHVDAAEKILSTDPEFSAIRKLRIQTSHAFHTSLSDPILSDLDAMSASLTWNEPQILLEACTSEPLTSIQDWSASRHTRGSVYFAKAVSRIEKRLGSCIWLEAGLDSAIVSMARKASSTLDSSVFQPVSTKTGPTNFVGGVISSLWRHGLSLTHWNMIQADRQPQPIWLPPYQFERESQWTTYCDRATEAHSLATTITSQAPLLVQNQPDPTKLVSKLTSPNGNLEFQISTQCERFQKVTAGHAVLNEPLCPASLYMECVVMAVGQLVDDIEECSLDFEDLEFHAGLGLQAGREVFLTIEELGVKRGWAFTVRSTRQGSSRALLHCSGRLLLSDDPVPTAFRRLVDAPMLRLDQSPNLERLMSWRAYSLFSSVMSYAEFLKPISSIIVDKNEALSTIKLPPHQPGLHESTAWRRCDAVFLDGFLSSSGLLLNSSNVISNGQVMIAVGVERALLTAACQAEFSPSWQSYVTFTMAADTHALCDVFVCTPEREVVAMMTGVRFNKMETAKLAKSLSSVNASHSDPRATSGTSQNTTKVPITSKITSSPGAVANHVPVSSAPTKLTPTESTTTIQHGTAPLLKSLISELVGLTAEDIPEESPLVDLGLDSLSSIEFTSEIQTKLGVKVDSEGVSDMTLRSLSQMISAHSSSGHTETVTEKGVHVDVPVATEAPPDIRPLITSYTGLPEEDIPADTLLVDLGLDSLSCIDFASELHKTFGIEIDSAAIGNLTLKSLSQSLQSADGASIASVSSAAQTGTSTPNAVSTRATTPFATGSLTPNWTPSATLKGVKTSNAINSSGGAYSIETVEFKRVSGVSIQADIYVPQVARSSAMPIALMIHGGGFMTLSRKAVRPAQARYLLANGLLPVSVDYRLCPEVNMIDGPITDVRDAYAWARKEMPMLLTQHGISVDCDQVVAVGWSTGGHLAMSLGWSTKAIGLPSPKAVLSFYAPVDFESGELDNQKNPALPKPSLGVDQIIAALPASPITSYGASASDETNLGWLRPGDPRSELLLTIFHSDIGLSLMLNGVPSSSTHFEFSKPPKELVASISPLAHVRRDTYDVPTFVIHGTKDHIVPYVAAERFVSVLCDKGVEADFLGLDGVPHVFDVKMKPGTKGWVECVQPGLDFLIKHVS